MNFPGIPDRRKSWPKPIINQPWKVALRPGTAGKMSNPVPGNYYFLFVCFLGTDLWAEPLNIKRGVCLAVPPGGGLGDGVPRSNTRASGPVNVNIWVLSGSLPPQNPVEKVGASPPLLFQWVLR